MGARTKYRKRALDILFESESRGLSADGTLADRLEVNDPPVNPYTVSLVEGVAANIGEIDALLAEYSVGWTLDRMPAVDRNLLRIAVYEIKYLDDVPDAVAISEAVELAKELSTDESPRFVNGLLSKVSQVKTKPVPPSEPTEPSEPSEPSEPTE
ncbi:transcription antitermination factor NusB [Aeromicrobium duanguangcaii]|uniref:Transcription antitermination protein NusB n=1 Tax=Aeromicrobium duanguangcaii TaxID=2968086 RepID=A0ABY5KHA2_9ACTN|nr:transcription antitermination factor NusB [Aeromicrobium duanguangcaii]MCD9153050.1 transcription antitermination factor NusB [Aeromicrobium duanguangcaii]UUI69844.1 transcription antitermination factor NusB [Aeromicrobium duanguangcaii]